MFKRMKIGVKLTLAFTIILAGLVAASVLSFVSMGQLEQADYELYNENLFGVSLISDISDAFNNVRIASLKAVYQNFGQANAAEFSAVYQENKQIIDMQLADYQASLINPEDQVNLDKLKPFLTGYYQEIEDLIEMVNMSSKSGAQAGIESTAIVAEQVAEQLDVMSNWNMNQGNKKYDANAQLSLTTKLTMVIVSSALIVLGIILSVFISRSISRPVNVTALQLNKMAAGENMDQIDADRYSGEFRGMVINLNEASDSLNRLREDILVLADAGIKGHLSVRADLTRHRGGYQQIIAGVNDTLDAVVNPINESATTLSRIAQGDLNAVITSNFAGDYAIIKDALNTTANSLRSYIAEIATVLGEMAQGNLDVAITSDFNGDFIALKDSINGIIDSLNTVMAEIEVASEQVAAGTVQVSQGSQEISQGATEQASSIEELTASITQMAEKTRQNAQDAGKANDLTNSAKNEAGHGNERMQAMQNSMSDIDEASHNIGRIIKVIDDIAFQTNILALNAAVEAARAGQHGKGFAVVAEEVRNLAARSAEAAKETTELIEGSISKTQAGTRIADDTAGALKSIMAEVENAALLVNEIATASNEQAGAIAEINNGIEQLSEVVQTNSATSEESAAAAEKLSGQAELLKNLVGQFKLKNSSDKKPKAVQNEQESPQHLEAQTASDFGKY